jgi:hypothetical protein
MSTSAIMLVVIAAAVIIYFVFFNESKKTYPQSKIKEIFVGVESILKPHEDDHRHIGAKKARIIEELKIIKKEYSRTPSQYTQKEIDAIEKLLPEIKQEFRDFCDTLIDLKPKLFDLIEAEKKMLESSKEVIKNGGDVADGSDDHEDIMDIMEKVIEFSPIKIKELEEELMLLEKSIARYKSI